MNYLWSPLLKWFQFKFGNREVQMGSPIIVLGLFIFFYVKAIAVQARKDQSGTTPRDRFVFLLCTTAAVIFALIVRLHDLSLWLFVYKLVPGASASGPWADI